MYDTSASAGVSTHAWVMLDVPTGRARSKKFGCLSLRFDFRRLVSDLDVPHLVVLPHGESVPDKVRDAKKSRSFVLVGYVVEFFSRVGWKRTGSLWWWEKGAERVGRAPSFSLNDVKRPAKLRCRSRARFMVRKSKATPFHNPYALSPPRGSQRRYRYGKTPRATRFC